MNIRDKSLNALSHNFSLAFSIVFVTTHTSFAVVARTLNELLTLPVPHSAMSSAARSSSFIYHSNLCMILAHSSLFESDCLYLLRSTGSIDLSHSLVTVGDQSSLQSKGR